MPELPIYLDNHATTRVDPRVVQAILPYFGEQYGNAASITHAFGHAAKAAVDAARQTIAAAINADPREIIFTSGATESNNLAIYGTARHARRRGDHVVSVVSEHKAVLDPMIKLKKAGYDVTLLPVKQQPADDCGLVDLDQVRETLRPDTCLVSVMMANNEIGVIQPIAEIGELCRKREIPFHTDAAQALGKLPIDVRALHVDLMSITAHKIYGPKGIGALFMRRGSPRLRIEPQIDGGGHENGMRSGTLNVPGVIGLASAIELCQAEMHAEQNSIAELRDRLYAGLVAALPDVHLNGPNLSERNWRLAGNLNCRFDLVDGEALALNMQELAVSTGSACTSANPEPSHVLKAIGLSEDHAHSSIRFGLGRFTTADEIDFAIQTVSRTVTRLRKLSSMAT